MKPTISRDVHYVSYGTPVQKDGFQAFPATCRAAKVTDVNDDDTIDIVVFNPSGIFFQHRVRLDETGCDSGTWHWPERVDS